jgi:hypothetical protein
MRNGFVVLAACIAAFGAGCPEAPNFLDGSIKDSRDLTFDSVQLRSLSDQGAWDLQYLKKLEGGGNDDIVAKIAFTEPAGGIKLDEEIDLLDEEIDGVVQRNTAAGNSDTFPAGLEKGVITFTAGVKVGDTAKGEFAATFDNGKTLFGAFETEVTEANFE